MAEKLVKTRIGLETLNLMTTLTSYLEPIGDLYKTITPVWGICNAQDVSLTVIKADGSCGMLEYYFTQDRTQQAFMRQQWKDTGCYEFLQQLENVSKLSLPENLG